MDALFDLFLALLIWRVLLSLVISIALALFLSGTFEGFTAGYCVILTFAGGGLGIYWDLYNEVQKHRK